MQAGDDNASSRMPYTGQMPRVTERGAAALPCCPSSINQLYPLSSRPARFLSRGSVSPRSVLFLAAFVSGQNLAATSCMVRGILDMTRDPAMVTHSAYHLS